MLVELDIIEIASSLLDDLSGAVDATLQAQIEVLVHQVVGKKSAYE